jgi:predicted RNA-binding Zn ribbon-like protein
VEFARYLDHPIGVAVDLVNSSSPDRERDDLVDPDALSSFLGEHGIGGDQRPTGEDLEQVRRLRDRLRKVFEAADHRAAAGLLNRLLADAGASPQLTDHDGGPWHLHYTAARAPLGRRLAADTAMALAVIIAEQGFDRLRVCEGERCRDVFVDRSRNRSRRYCSPEVCGNRASVAAYRARQRAAKRG